MYMFPFLLLSIISVPLLYLVRKSTAQTIGENSLTSANTSDAAEAEQDIPKTIQDLFSNTSSGDILGPGIGGLNGSSSNTNSNGGPFQYPGLVTYNMANFGASKHLGPIQYNYPSKYLLQTTGNEDEEDAKKEITPTDTQIACEYILTKYKSVHSQAQHRLSIQKEMQEANKEKEKDEKNGSEDQKLLEIEEGGEASSNTDADNVTNGVNGKLTTSTKPKSKTLPPIQVPGFSKIYSTIKESHPNWVFSEKRLRKIIKDGEDAASSSASSSSNEPKESAMLEADRIVKLAGLMGSGKYATDLVPISRFDSVLQQELDDQWAATNGLPLPSSSSSSSAAITSSPSTSSAVPAANGENKENEEPSSGSSSKSKKKKGSSSKVADVAEAVVNGITEGAETLVNKVSTSFPGTSTTNVVASSSSSSATLAALTSAPTKRNPTNAVGDVALKWFGPIKGRGVVARRKFKKGSIIFRE